MVSWIRRQKLPDEAMVSKGDRTMKNVLSATQGCLIGGAIGDALGYPVEFYQEQQIFSMYGSREAVRRRIYVR
jgi:hypothetical protein